MPVQLLIGHGTLFRFRTIISILCHPEVRFYKHEEVCNIKACLVPIDFNFHIRMSDGD